MSNFTKNLAKILALLALILTLGQGNVLAKTYTIKDVKSDDPAYENIKNVLDQGWMSLTLGNFYPNKNVTRGEFALILSKYDSDYSTVKSVTKSSFKDVSVKNANCKYIEAEKKYLTYYKQKDGNYFKPDNFITREDALAGLVKAAGFKLDSSDLEVSLDEIIQDANKVTSSIKTYVTIGVIKELINLEQKDDGVYLNPKKYITRSQLAVLLDNAANTANASIENGDEIDSSDNNLEEVTEPKSATTQTPTQKQESKQESSSTATSQLEININGTDKVYKATSQMDYTSSKWFVAFHGPDYNPTSLSLTDTICIGLPSDVKAGNTYRIESNKYSSAEVLFYDKDGYYYPIEYPILSGNSIYNYGTFKSGYYDLTIEKFEGRDGIVSGTLSGFIQINDVDSINFSNGKFSVNIAKSKY